MLKEELLELLEKDRGFRLAVACLIGYKELLERLEEHDKKFNEVLKRLEKHDEKFVKIVERLNEHDRKFDEILERLREHDQKFDGIVKRLEEHDRRFFEVVERLEEHNKKFNEILERLEAHDRKFNEMLRELGDLRARVEVTIGSMGRRWGVDLEKTVLSIFKEVLEERGVEPGKVEKFRYRDVDGRVTGVRGRTIDVDVLVSDDKVYVIEVKSRVELEHVEALPDKARAVEKLLNKPVARVMIVAVNVDREALERAQELGIEVIAGSILD